MNWLPNDLLSFVWGAVLAAIGLIATGLLREAGKELWLKLKRKLFPEPLPPPEPVLVDLRFQPEEYKAEDCIWVRAESLYRFESEGHTYYPHPKNGGKCVRGYDREASYLMVRPNAKKQPSA